MDGVLGYSRRFSLWLHDFSGPDAPQGVAPVSPGAGCRDYPFIPGAVGRDCMVRVGLCAARQGPDHYRPGVHVDVLGFCGIADRVCLRHGWRNRQLSGRSEEHTSELQSLMRISYAVFCLKKKNKIKIT